MKSIFQFIYQHPIATIVGCVLFTIGLFNVFIIVGLLLLFWLYSVLTKPKPYIPDYSDIPKSDSITYPFSTTGPILSSKYMSEQDKSNYLASAMWRILRDIIITRDHNKCVCCSSTNNLHVHHLTYDRLGSEQPNDLVTLCSTCHQRQHDYYGYDRDIIYYPLIKD